MIRGHIHVVPHEDIFTDRYDALFSEAIATGLKAEQKARGHWEQEEPHSTCDQRMRVAE